MPRRTYTVGAYSTKYNTDVGYLVTPNIYTPSTTKVILGCHGHGQGGYGTVGSYPMEPHCTALVNAGYAMFGLDHAKVNAWGDPDAMRAMDDAYTYLTGLGFNTTKVGIDGWSMGGLTGLNWIRRNASKVACAWLWNPVTDLRFFRDTSGAYTPAYPLGGATASQALYASEINSTYGASTTVSGGYTIPAAGGTGVTMTVASGYSFADGLSLVGLPTATVAAANFTYTGKTDTTLIGCLSTTASTITVTNGAAITSSYATQSNGYRIYDEPTAWTSLGVRVMISQASDDVTVAPGMNTDASNGFVAKVGSSNVTLRTPTPTGGHTLSIPTIPVDEVVTFFRSNLG